MKTLFGLVVLALGIVLAGAPSGALAGGTSDASGDGYHCYQFFELPDGNFAQVITNDSVEAVVTEKILEFLYKYEVSEGGKLKVSTGNLKSCLLP